jgi:hypothetical protein
VKSFLNGPHELRSLLEVLKDAVDAGHVSPLGNMQGEIALGLDDDCVFYLELTQRPTEGLWVHLRRADSRDPVCSWSAREVGAVVPALWESCRNRLYTAEMEEGLAAIVRWTRSQSR